MYKIGMKKLIYQFDLELQDIIPVFHQWIQEDSIPEHLAIDVADYKHIPDGPGIMLITHEGNISIDNENNEIGLLYIRKQPISESFTDNIQKIKLILNSLAEQLANHPDLIGKIIFKEKYKIISNDRLLLPNDTSSKQQLISHSEKVFEDMKISIINSNLNSRLTIEIQ